MALKADRHELDVEISFFCNVADLERGGILVLDTVGSGAAMDQAGAKVKYAVATNALFPVGILLNDTVNLDLTRQHINWHKDEVQKGGKVSILKKGWVVTNLISGTPAAGLGAFVSDDNAGYIGTQASVTDGKYIQIGRFMSTKDEDGYAKVEVNLPMPVDNDAAASAPE